MNKDVFSDDFLLSFPEALKNDTSLMALAQVVSTELHQLVSETQEALIYTKIDTLPEMALDLLAYDFKVDWYDFDYSLEEKRATLKKSWDVHRHLGTPFAVEAAISAVYPDTEVQEWFRYQGEPYHFKLMIDVTFENINPAKHQRVMGLVNYYKNLRSVLDRVEYYDSGGSAVQYCAAFVLDEDITDTAVAVRY